MVMNACPVRGPQLPISPLSSRTTNGILSLDLEHLFKHTQALTSQNVSICICMFYTVHKLNHMHIKTLRMDGAYSI